MCAACVFVCPLFLSNIRTQFIDLAEKDALVIEFLSHRLHLTKASSCLLFFFEKTESLKGHTFLGIIFTNSFCFRCLLSLLMKVVHGETDLTFLMPLLMKSLIIIVILFVCNILSLVYLSWCLCSCESETATLTQCTVSSQEYGLHPHHTHHWYFRWDCVSAWYPLDRITTYSRYISKTTSDKQARNQIWQT